MNNAIKYSALAFFLASASTANSDSRPFVSQIGSSTTHAYVVQIPEHVRPTPRRQAAAPRATTQRAQQPRQQTQRAVQRVSGPLRRIDQLPHVRDGVRIVQ